MARKDTVVVSLRLQPDDHQFLLELADRELRKPGDTLRWLLQREKRQVKRKRPVEQPA